MLLFLFLEILILLGFGAAIVMATRTRKAPVTVINSDRSDLDIEALAIKIATAVATQVAKEFIEKLGTVGYHGSQQSPLVPGDLVDIDESIIPVSVSTQDITVTELEVMKEEIAPDVNLSNAKSKLAAMLKNKKKEA